METKFAINKRLSLFFLFFIFFIVLSFSQNQPPMYLEFYENSSESCNIHSTRRSRLHTVNNIQKYVKTKLKSWNVSFYICGELFIHEKSIMEKRVVCKSFLNDKRLIGYEELVDFLNKMQDKYPMGYKYPSNEYPKIYIPIHLSDSHISLYEVKWEYYIE